MTDTVRIAASLVARGKGILAADENIGTMSKRLETEGIAASETARRDYRQLLLATPGLSAWVSGVIFCDETLRQRLSDGRRVPEAAAELGIRAGIKVDTGVVPLPFAGGAVVTEGIDGLRGRLEEYRDLGASNERACTNLTAINRLSGEQGGARWALSFSFGRALVSDALRIWGGQPCNVAAAEEALAANCARAGEAAIPVAGRRLANA